MSAEAADAQQHRWNGSTGQVWVAAQALLDGMFAPLEAALVEAAVAAGAGSVLDVGCGTGGTTVALARALGPQARCLGVDISQPMLDAAEARSAQAGASAGFLRADAQSQAFPAGCFDRIVSRFGVMFFQDFVAAFANLRRAARAGAALDLIAWRTPAENPFMTAAERAAAALLPELPARRPGQAGQFAFAEQAFVEGLLRDSGWRDIEILPIDIPCAFPAESLEFYMTRMGPVGQALQDCAPTLRASVLAALRPAFARYVQGDRVLFTAACWRILAYA
jgi:SAM-dependent methyltransferase